MAISMRAGGSWRDPIGIYGRVSGSWRLIKDVYVRAGGSWRRVGGAMSGASATGGSGYCVFWPPDTSCTPTASATAYPIGGYPPFTYQWEVVRDDAWVSHGSTTSKTLQMSSPGPVTGLRYADVRCRVGDATGATYWTNTVTVSFQSERGGM